MWTNIRDDLFLWSFDMRGVKLNTFRHTCATRLAEGGIDLLALRDWLGHSDIKITATRYVHRMATYLHHGVNILSAQMADPSAKSPSNGANSAISDVKNVA